MVLEIKLVKQEVWFGLMVWTCTAGRDADDGSARKEVLRQIRKGDI